MGVSLNRDALGIGGLGWASWTYEGEEDDGLEACHGGLCEWMAGCRDGPRKAAVFVVVVVVVEEVSCPGVCLQAAAALTSALAVSVGGWLSG